MSRSGRRPSTPRKRIIFIIAVLALGALVVRGSPWPTRIVSGSRVLLNYPSLISSDTARMLLADRERALAFAEEALGGQLFRRLIITIEPTLLTSAGRAEPTEGGGAITFYIPVSALEQFESDGTSPFGLVGCHEEAHAVANHLWLSNELGTLGALSEGIAVYVEELRRGTSVHRFIASALQASELLYDVDQLLGAFSPDDPARVIQLNIYYGGASFAEFLIDRYGLEAFSELYGLEWIQWDIRNLDDHPVQVDPALEIQRIFGATMAQIDTEWQAWVASHSTCSRADAEVFLQAYTTDVAYLEAGVPELEEYWATYPLRLVGPSPLIAGLYEKVTNAVFWLAELRGTGLAEAYAAFRDSVDRLGVLLSVWLDAIHALEEALELISTGEGSERVDELLEAAEAGYATVEDTHMLNRVRELLAECATKETASVSS